MGYAHPQTLKFASTTRVQELQKAASHSHIPFGKSTLALNPFFKKRDKNMRSEESLPPGKVDNGLICLIGNAILIYPH